MSVDVDFN